MIERNHKPGSEAELVELFRRLFEPDVRPTDLLIGIGDDAAAIEPGVDPETKFVITADMLMEDVHFRLRYHSFYDIGWRTGAANLSDIAAMGAMPRWGLVTLAAPANLTVENIMDLARGIRDASAEYNACVIGGDLTRSTGKIAISMTLIGETTSRLLTRGGARPGDVIAVTGNLGAAGAGLFLLENDGLDVPDDLRKSLVDAHLRPHARIHAGQVFANTEGVRAMMDISDGLGIDLGRLCEASGTGARVMEDAIPVSDAVRRVADAAGRDCLEFVNAGEDFELLIAGELAAIDRARRVLLQDAGQPTVSIIGEILDAPFGIHLARMDGSVINPSQLGWDHFRRAEGPGG